MILGFLGKGGSGKSSVATQMALFLCRQEKDVLAIDADHNMDLSFNLTHGEIPRDMPYLGASLLELQYYVGVKSHEKYSQVFLRETNVRFSFQKERIDAFTKKYSYPTSQMRIMAAGPQTDQVMYGQSCSHILTTPLKIYLPLLDLGENQDVIVDEKAGADGVTTGIVTGVDVAVVVCEPTLHSIKTAQQIIDLLKFYNTPHVLVANKIMTDDDLAFISTHLAKGVDIYLRHNNSVRTDPSASAMDWQDELALLYTKASQLNRNDRMERTKAKFIRHANFNTQK